MPANEHAGRGRLSRCYLCKGPLVDVILDQRLWVDGAHHEVKLPAQECQKCGETTIPGPEVRKATEAIRSAQGYSGKLILRMPPTLHKSVADLAREHGKSINQELVEIIEQGTKKAVGE